ncbi:urease accessory protein ureD [Roseivivax halodurans JCM 10272]|uniref:Urease accessory protein UreD n=2 Tax=Roseivivax halodurans TaxID=93683 RepID=X7EJC3_9RHOB|nr:urease accessory protein ureD [Roseivivax halodurans JCM 10272]
MRRRGESSVIADLMQSGSSKLMFPHPQGDALQAVWLNTAGGITGGDDFSLSVEVAPEAKVALTTQAAERIYRAVPGAPGRVRTRLSAGQGAMLHWLPQETILFDRGSLDRTLSVDLAGCASFLGIETLIFGRAAMGERVRDLHLRDRIDLRVDGTLVYADRLALDGDAETTLGRPHVADGAGAVATLILAAPGASGRLDSIRTGLPDTAGASAPSEDLVVARLLAPDGFEMRRTLVPLLTALSDAPLPRPWMI